MTTKPTQSIPEDVLKKLIKRAQRGDLEARDAILIEFTPLLDYVCSRLKSSKIDEGAIRYGGILGLLAAIKNYDFSSCRFFTYAYCCVFCKAKREMNNDHLVRLPNQKMNEVLQGKRKGPQYINISENPNITQIKKLPNLFKSDSDIDSDESELNNIMLKELITYDTIEDREIKKFICDSMNELTELERDTIYHKYGCISNNLHELGKKHGVSYEWVRISANKAFKKLNKIFFKKINNKTIK